MSKKKLWLLLLLAVVVPIGLFVFSNTQLSWKRIWTTKSRTGNGTSLRGGPSPAQFFVSYPHPYGLLLDQPDQCRLRKPFLVLMIPVAPQNRAARDAIRQTWAGASAVLGRVVSHYFFLGRANEKPEAAEALQEQVIGESQEHGDILQGDFLESYHNLTIKTMLMMEWLSARCPDASYAMKVDSDMFLNVHNLLRMLRDAPRRDYMTGIVNRAAPVLRDPDSKWFLPEEVFPDALYPPYALGLGYVFSMDLPGKLVAASAHVRAVYLEDVYLGLCMRHLGIDPSDPPDPAAFRATPPYHRSLCYWSSVIGTLLETPRELLDAWTDYQHTLRRGCCMAVFGHVYDIILSLFQK